jgi:hypothetical protein
MAEGDPLSDQKRKLLEMYLRRGTASPARVDPGITLCPPGEDVPLSLSQEQLVLREEQTPDCPALYNESIIVRMRGQVESAILERCLSEIIRRHEIWRTSYLMKGGRLRQVVHPPEDFRLATFDLRAISRREKEPEIQGIMREIVEKQFDLRNGPLLRGVFLRLAEFEQWLCLCAHLSIVDGMSVYQILPTELCALYRAFSCGQPTPLSDLRLQYRDYAWWQRQHLLGEDSARQIEYWRKQLGGNVAVLNWPKDKARPSRETFRGTIHSFDVPKELVHGIKAVSQREGVTLFLIFLTAFVVLLHGYAGQETIVVGTPSPAGRERREVQSLLGYFLTPVALRFDLTGNPTFQHLLRQAQRLLLEALANDDVPLELLAKELKVPDDPSRNPFFTVAVSQQPALPHLDMDWSVTSMEIGSGGTPWDLYLAFIDQPQATIARVQYNTDLFESETIARIMGQYVQLLETLARNPAQRLSEARSPSDRAAPTLSP